MIEEWVDNGWAWTNASFSRITRGSTMCCFPMVPIEIAHLFLQRLSHFFSFLFKGGGKQSTIVSLCCSWFLFFSTINLLGGAIPFCHVFRFNPCVQTMFFYEFARWLELRRSCLTPSTLETWIFGSRCQWCSPSDEFLPAAGWSLVDAARRTRVL